MPRPLDIPKIVTNFDDPRTKQASGGPGGADANFARKYYGDPNSPLGDQISPLKENEKNVPITPGYEVSPIGESARDQHLSPQSSIHETFDVSSFEGPAGLGGFSYDRGKPTVRPTEWPVAQGQSFNRSETRPADIPVQSHEQSGQGGVYDYQKPYSRETQEQQQWKEQYRSGMGRLIAENKSEIQGIRDSIKFKEADINASGSPDLFKKYNNELSVIANLKDRETRLKGESKPSFFGIKRNDTLYNEQLKALKTEIRNHEIARENLIPSDSVLATHIGEHNTLKQQLKNAEASLKDSERALRGFERNQNS